MIKFFLSCLLAFNVINLASTLINNDISYLAKGDPQYAGLIDAPMYINEQAIVKEQQLEFFDNPTHYQLEVVLPGNVAADIMQHSFLLRIKWFLQLFTCHIFITHTPQEQNVDTLYLTDILIEKINQWKKNQPAIKIRPYGWRSLAVTVIDVPQ